jgi:alpha-1,6-mannosyltransferase
LKTLHLTNAWHASSGGIGTFYRALLEAANREGHHMRLVVPGDRTHTEEAGAYGRIYHIEAPRAPLNGNYRIIYPHRFLFPNTALQRILNSERPDLVEVSEKYTMPYFASLLRTRSLPGVKHRPTVVGLSCERMDENFSAYIARGARGRHFCETYMKWIYFPSFDHHIAVSEYAAAELIGAARGIWVAPMGVDCDRFTPARRSAEVRQRLHELTGAPEGACLLLYAGRLAPEKNLPLLIETMALLDPREYRLAIAGEGMLLEELRAECSRRELGHVAFLGHITSRDELADLYANADIFLHPNPREPFGIAPLEAMSSGIAVVAPAEGGVMAYATRENAWLTGATPMEFATAVRAIRAGGSSKSAAARATALEYGWPKVAAHFLNLYGDLHALTQGSQTRASLAARTWSTPGDWLGREVSL